RRLANRPNQDKINFDKKRDSPKSRSTGVDMMHLKPRLLLLSSLVPASLALGAGTGAVAQDHAHMTMPARGPSATTHPTRWSDPASWPDGKVPRAGAAVTIER